MGPLLPDEFNPETFPMLRVLPGLVVRTLRKHFYAGVKEAEVRFRYHRADGCRHRRAGRTTYRA